VPLCRERRAVWKARAELARRAGRITALHLQVGLALLRRLAQDGRLDPSHATLAGDAGCGERTVRRALDALRGCGLACWVRRLVRNGWHVSQTSNQYVLTVGETADFGAPRYGGQVGRQALKQVFPKTALEQGGAEAAELRRADAVPAARWAGIAQGMAARRAALLRSRARMVDI
jgi:hypothetical protein